MPGKGSASVIVRNWHIYKECVMDKMEPFAGPRKKEMMARTFHLETDQLQPLRKVSELMGVSQSEVVRRSINFFIEGYHRATRKQAKGKSGGS